MIASPLIVRAPSKTTFAASVVSVQTGRIQTLGEGEKTWRSAFLKTPRQGKVAVLNLGLEGDQQADKRWHGGPEMAVLGYAASHYLRWREELVPEVGEQMGPGAFAENLTIAGLTEQTVSIGDIHRIGSARLQVCQHRGPCSKIEKRWCLGGLVKRVTETARCGWYYRVLTEGELSAGEELVVEARPNPMLTVEACFRAKVSREPDRAMLESLVGCEAIAAELRDELRAKL